MGTAPVPPPPHVFVLHPDRLAYGACQARGDGSVLTSYRSVELPPDTFQAGLLGGPVKDAEALGQAVESLVADLGERPKAATLALPDAWFRVVFSELDELPEGAAARREVLTWKLKRLVPFRIDDVRLSGAETPRLPKQQEALRVMVGFARDELLRQIEDLFSAAGIRLGLITAQSLLSQDALRRWQDGITALALVGGQGYTLLFLHEGEPVLHRFKDADRGLPEDARRRLVARDLKLSRIFVDEQLPDLALGRVVLAATPAQESLWAVWLQEAFGLPVSPITEADVVPLETDFRQGAPGAPGSWLEVLPMIGASRQEVS